MIKAIKNSIPRKTGPNVYVSIKALIAFIAVSLPLWYWGGRDVKVLLNNEDKAKVVVAGNGVGAIFFFFLVVVVIGREWGERDIYMRERY